MWDNLRNGFHLCTGDLLRTPKLVPNHALYQAEEQPENKFIARPCAPLTSRILIQTARTELQGVTAWAAVVFSMFIDLCRGQRALQHAAAMLVSSTGMK